MADAYLQGVTTPYNYNSVVVTDIYGIAINAFANRNPLFSRLGIAALNAMSFVINNDNFRGPTITINNSGGYNTTDTAMVVVDASAIMKGDVLEFVASDQTVEQVLVTNVVPSTETLTVTRAYGGTTGKTIADASLLYIVGNSRTGAETEQSGVSRLPATVTQYSQVFQHPYQVGGAIGSASNFALPPGFTSLLGRERGYAMQNCADDIERTFYYGKGVVLAASTTRPQMKGLRALISTNASVSPTSYAAYKPADLIRDTISKCYRSGGNPDLLLVSTDFMEGLSTWGHAVQRLDAGETMFGTPISVFEAPFLGGVKIVPAPLLRSGSTFCLTSGEVRHRVKRAMFDKPRGSRGDADEGDIIAEGAIELDNEAHHAYVTGITGFAAA